MTAADYPGLSTAEAERRLEAEGPNTLPDGGQHSTFAIVFGNLAMIHATRSRDRVFFATLRVPNPALWWITGGTLVALAASVYIPLIGNLFRFAPLAVGQMALAAAAGIAGVLWYEVYKVLRPRNARG